MSSLLDEDFRLEGAVLDSVGKADFLGAMKAQMTAFPDYSENPTEIEERDDRVYFVAHVTGTQLGTLALPGIDPVEATGRSIRLPPEPAWVQVKDGKLLVYHVDAVAGGGIAGILEQLKTAS